MKWYVKIVITKKKNMMVLVVAGLMCVHIRTANVSSLKRTMKKANDMMCWQKIIITGVVVAVIVFAWTMMSMEKHHFENKFKT